MPNLFLAIASIPHLSMGDIEGFGDAGLSVQLGVASK
jgi:hypothetical protein